jgi:hypothetical protein
MTSYDFCPSLTSTVTSRCAEIFSVFLNVSNIIATPLNFSCPPCKSPSLKNAVSLNQIPIPSPKNDFPCPAIRNLTIIKEMLK